MPAAKMWFLVVNTWEPKQWLGRPNPRYPKGGLEYIGPFETKELATDWIANNKEDCRFGAKVRKYTRWPRGVEVWDLYR